MDILYHSKNDCCKIIKKTISRHNLFYYGLACPKLFMADFDNRDVTLVYEQFMDFDNYIYPRKSAWLIFSSDDGYHGILLSEMVPITDHMLVQKYTEVLKGDPNYYKVAFEAVNYLHRFSRVFDNDQAIYRTNSPRFLGFYGDINSILPNLMDMANFFYTLCEMAIYDHPFLTYKDFRDISIKKIIVELPEIIIYEPDLQLDEMINLFINILNDTGDHHWHCHDLCSDKFNIKNLSKSNIFSKPHKNYNYDSSKHYDSASTQHHYYNHYDSASKQHHYSNVAPTSTYKSLDSYNCEYYTNDGFIPYKYKRPEEIIKDALMNSMNHCHRNCGTNAILRMMEVIGTPSFYSMPNDTYHQLDALNHRYWSLTKIGKNPKTDYINNFQRLFRFTRI